ncbi:MAG: hypothetical protein KJ558_03970 [Gammaproteobacteria bacterium]|nr:hypothetical protein [Gammaproteobacteria bacterium]MBU1653980.1 hypothetical protein [Gammaproteobacteria bacterium]MBU1960468.1 hypothetical protein [Gammaproteobacteria bacterium]
MAILAILQGENEKYDFSFSSFSMAWAIENGGSSLNRKRFLQYCKNLFREI